MKPLFVFYLAALSTMVGAQCLTDFTKLTPDPTIDFNQEFGRSVSMFDDYVAVGIPNSDSLGRITGIVQIYKKITGTWKKVASIAPSDPRDALQFGISVKLSGDYLLVGAAGYGGKVYLYKKFPGGWASQTELTSFTVPNSVNFGAGMNQPFDMSVDQNTIVIADQWYASTPLPTNYLGALFVYHKQAAFEWNSSIVPSMIHAPEVDAADFGRGGVVIYEDRIITSMPFSPTGNGRIYIYRDVSGDFINPQLEAKLVSGSPAESSFLGIKNFVVTADGIFASAVVDLHAEPKSHVIFFEKPFSGTWSDGARTCSIDPFGDGTADGFLNLSSNGADVYVSSANGDGSGFLSVLRRNGSAWCGVQPEIIESFIPSPSQLMGNYGVLNACNQSSDLVLGYVPHPASPNAQIALKLFSSNASNGWDSQFLYSSKKSTAGHRFGATILGFEDYLFACAPYDNSVRSSGGAVYTYKKNGTTWDPIGKILPPIRGKYDDVFGTALATNGTHLAVGALGFEEHGRIFIYKKKNSDWSDVEMVQEIELPHDILIVYASGDNLAMNKDWLVIPYVQNSPARIMLAIYKFNGDTWDYSQVVEVGMGNLFAKETTTAVDIHDNTILAGNVIIELNQSGEWEVKHVLSPSDPEPMQIAPDFSHWITNGSMFGHSVDISENSIFISAPTKDHEGMWDVGAIYVYTKRPWQSWSSMTETAKILPRVKDEGELFGWSLKVLDNTLIAGAPGADFTKDGVTARNKPGRAYVFQSVDYFWQDVVPLVDMTGDSFVKDYFGIAVNLDETDFFIGAAIEDLDNGKLSGSVYITPTPPIIKLVAPVCSTKETIDLFGYPFGGIWSGPGIIDAAKGIFDPKIAGLGEHEFVYKTTSCTYTGKLKISIESPAMVNLLGPLEYTVCPGKEIHIPFTIQGEPDYNFMWYYRESSDDYFVASSESSNNMIATARGQYQARMYNTVCESLSSIISIKDETLRLGLSSLPRICYDQPDGILLSATPNGGLWQGPGVGDNKLYTIALNNGIYELTYHYTSSSGCQYDTTMKVEIDRLPKPVVERAYGDLCVEGAVTLSASHSAGMALQYEWAWKGIDQSSFTLLPESGSEVEVRSRGVYQVTAHNGECRATSNPLTINDNTFEAKMSPAENEFKLCDGSNLEFSFKNVPGRTYQWFYAETPEAEEKQVGGNADSYTVDKTGIYFVRIQSGICSMESSRKSVTIFPEDHVFIPNVFTPNGDGFNDEFKVESNQDDLQFRVLNRYGQLLYSGNGSVEWTGDNTPSGVYFCVVSYNTCTGEHKKEKGTVHLVR